MRQRIRVLEQAEVQRRQTEGLLRQSEKEYKLLSEKMSDILWITDLELRTLYVSPSVEKVLGFSQEERMVQTLPEQLTPESLSLAIETLTRELTNDVQGGGDEPERAVTIALEYRHKDGSTRWLETILNGIRDAQGALVSLHGVSRDITERRRAEENLRESEEKHRLLIENLPIAIYVEIRGRFVYVNPAFLTLFRLSAQEEILGKPLLEFVPPELIDTLEKQRRLMIEEKASFPPLEMNIRRRDETVITVVSRPMPVLFDGQPAILGVLNDITERKQKEIELQKAHKLLEIQAAEIEGLRSRLKAPGIGGS
ncbi:MAG: PAS domain S-box protein [Deltaproteobacteria bacterium]|nr:PAS domain S-box protein [Deltaproteobacteria bacterium]